MKKICTLTKKGSSTKKVKTPTLGKMQIGGSMQSRVNGYPKKKINYEKK